MENNDVILNEENTGKEGNIGETLGVVTLLVFAGYGLFTAGKKALKLGKKLFSKKTEPVKIEEKTEEVKED